MFPGVSAYDGSPRHATTTSLARAAATAAGMSIVFAKSAPGTYVARAPSLASIARRTVRRSGGYSPGRSPCHVIVEQTEPRFHREHARHRFVDARHRYGAVVYELHQQIGEAVIGRHHAHVDAGEHGDARRLLLVRRNVMRGHEPLDVFPVRDRDAVEPELAAENVGEEVPVRMSRHAV